MKKNLLIALAVLIANALAITKIYAQDNKPQLIADETTISYLKNDAKIETDSEVIAMKLVNRFNQIIKRLTWTMKKDRHGSYKHYSFVINKEDAEIIKSWAKKEL